MLKLFVTKLRRVSGTPYVKYNCTYIVFRKMLTPPPQKKYKDIKIKTGVVVVVVVL